jgi:uncharacterized protein (TIGR02118 family)
MKTALRIKKMPITLTVMYPNIEGSKFDLEYYLSTHMDLVAKRMGSGILSARVVKGIGTPNPNTPAPYQIMAIIEFENMDILHKSMTEHAEEIIGDIANFTDVEAVIQISENLG